MGTEVRKTVQLRSDVVTQQPTTSFTFEDIWMAYPKSVPKGISSGLAFLFTVDTLVINRRLDLIEEFVGWQIPNAFTVTNVNGKHMYYAMETSSCKTMFWCGSSRRIEINVYDNSHQEAIRFIKPLHCVNSCCCPMKMKVFSPPNFQIGTVVLTNHPCRFRFTIKDSLGKKIYYVKGPCLCSLNVGNINFRIINVETNQEIGKIEKFESENLIKWFGGKKTFTATIPVDLDVQVKVLFLGLLFLVDYYFLDL